MSAAASLARRLNSLGFDPPRLAFALRVAVTAGAAVLIALALGLEHPQWSGMTVWAASLPVRGQLLEKSFFRFAGTISGVVVGVGLVALSPAQPIVLVLGLALWIGLCAGIGNLQRGFVAYGTMLAGYSAAMVALLGTSHPDHILALGIDRLLTISVGVLAALVSGGLFLPRRPSDVLSRQIAQITGRVLALLAGSAETPRAIAGLFAEIASLEEALDPHGAGSRQSRQSARALRALLIANAAALLWRQGTEETAPPSHQQAALRQAAALAEKGDLAAARRALPPGETRPPGEALPPAWAAVIDDLANALTSLITLDRSGPTPPPAIAAVILHRDWIGARQALIRAGGTLLIAGGLWLASGWSAGPFMMLGLSIMLSLFSAFDHPARLMRVVAFGQLLGVIGALTCRWLIWPGLDSPWAQVLTLLPFVLLGALIAGHRRSLPVAFDYNMVMLLLLQPGVPLSGSFGHSLLIGAAVIAAPLIAWAVYSLIYPVDAKRRMAMIATMMVHDLTAMARRPHPEAKRLIWQRRFYHRLLRLVRFADKSGATLRPTLDGGLAVLMVGRAILALRRLHDQAEPALSHRALTLALHRLSQLDRHPERAARTLMRAAHRLAAADRPEAAVIIAAATALQRQHSFFARRGRS